MPSPCNVRAAKLVVGLLNLTLVLSSPANAEGRYVCEIIRISETIKCHEQGEVTEVGPYSIPGLSAVLGSQTLQGSAGASLPSLEAYREAAENFRGSKIERFRQSIEIFRSKAEDERRLGHQDFYEALMDIYGQLMDLYREGMANYRAQVQKYREDVSRVTVP